jgi:glycosyltransferase involved in cell wall biosynthesis
MGSQRILYMIFSAQPSAKVRGENFKEILEENGFEVNYYYDFSKWISNKITILSRFRSLGFFVFFLKGLNFTIRIAKRKWLVKHINDYDGIIIIKNIDVDFLKIVRVAYKGKLLFDHDDAIWIPLFQGEEIYEKLITGVDYVSCDNAYLMKKALTLNKKSFVLNGPAQVELFDKVTAPQKNDNGQLIIGWVGSPSTLYYLYSIYDALEKVGQMFPFVKLVLLGVGEDELLRPQFEKISTVMIPFYNQSKMLQIVKTFDIGLYPLFNNEQSLGRGSLKATVYMSAKVPAVCADFGENQRIIQNRKNGLLAKTEEDWFNAIVELINHPELHSDIANNGYNYVKEHYSLEACFNQLKVNFLNHL